MTSNHMEVPVFMTCRVAHKDTPAQQNAKRKAPSKTLYAFSSPDVFPYCQLKERITTGAGNWCIRLTIIL